MFGTPAPQISELVYTRNVPPPFKYQHRVFLALTRMFPTPLRKCHHYTYPSSEHMLPAPPLRNQMCISRI